MPRSLLDLAADLETRRDVLPQQASQAAVILAQNVLKDLGAVTPVDTTKAVSNWQVTLDAPAATERDAYYPGVQGDTHAASAQAMLYAGNQVLSEKQPGQKVYITNNVDYIENLNNGSSKQAPAGFVERSLLVGRNVIQNIQLDKLK